MKTNFSPQIFSLWQSGFFSICWIIWRSRNKRIFEDTTPNITTAKAWVLTSLKEANSLIYGPSRNSLGIKNNLPIGPSIVPVSWNLPPPGWIKVKIDDAAKVAPGAGCGGIFRTCRSFVKGCFSTYQGTYPCC